MFQQHTMVSPAQTPNFVLPRCLGGEDWAGQNSASAGLILPFWQFDLQARTQSISPEKSIMPLIQSDSSSSTPQPRPTHRLLHKGSNGLVLLQEVQNSAVSAPFRDCKYNLPPFIKAPEGEHRRLKASLFHCPQAPQHHCNAAKG